MAAQAQFLVTVPAGSPPGSQFTVQAPTGAHLVVTVPPNAQPGHQFPVMMPSAVPPPPPPIGKVMSPVPAAGGMNPNALGNLKQPVLHKYNLRDVSSTLLPIAET